MKKYLSRAFAVLLAACLICIGASNATAVKAFAATKPDTKIPEITVLTQEIKETANYVAGKTNFSSIYSVSAFYGTSRNLILCLRSGIDCNEQALAYLAAVKEQLNSDGTLKITSNGNANDTSAMLAYLLEILALQDQDATNFYGVNILSAFDAFLGTADDTTFTQTSLNPYHLGNLYAAVYAYKDELTHSAKAIELIKTALLDKTTANGYDYYGITHDNNGIVYAPFDSLYKTDSTVKSAIDLAITNSANDASMYDPSTGISISWGTPNGDTTAMALAFYAQFENKTLAASSYNALMSFKATSTPGAFAYTGNTANPGASIDALSGLITYERALTNKTNPFDVSDVLSAGKTQPNLPGNTNEADNELPASQIPETPQTSDSANFYLLMIMAVSSLGTIILITYKNTKHILN
jgi:hypothetical protein